MAEVDPSAVLDTADPDATTGSSPAVPLLRRPYVIVEVFVCGAAPRGPPPGGPWARTATP